MNLLGAHLSIVGGYHRAVSKGAAFGMSALQIFVKSQLQWASKKTSNSELELYEISRKEHPEVEVVFAHGSYLYNFSSPEYELVKRSKQCMLNELELCDALGLPYLVIHPGSHMGCGEMKGIERVIQNLTDVLGQDQGSTTICIETTAGQGSSLGFRFEHLRDIISGVGRRVGACVDTCHIFAAGYDIRSYAGYRSVIEEFDRVVGFPFLKVVHLNDSRGELGSRVDRHTHIGRGKIGKQGFRFFMQDAHFEAIPKVIETPKKMNGKDMDSVNLQILRGLIA
jgi:deoxyribonuclease-4